jgi:hypothetical protein
MPPETCTGIPPAAPRTRCENVRAQYAVSSSLEVHEVDHLRFRCGDESHELGGRTSEEFTIEVALFESRRVFTE